MGEANRRGTYEERKRAAIRRNKDQLVQMMGERDEPLMEVLRAGLEPFLSQLSTEEWHERRSQIIDSLNAPQEASSLEKVKSIRFKEDEIAWYLFLCQQTLDDPLFVESSQAQRILPFFAGIGEKWASSCSVKGLDRKIKEVITKYKSDPDGVLFEILVALSYAAKGWEVELLEECPPLKSPDMVVRKDGRELYIECKRLNRRTGYADQERNNFLRIWDATVPTLIANKQWLWLKINFHSEVHTLPTDFLANILKSKLPIKNQETLIHDNADATIYARHIDREAVTRHLAQFMVKEPSPMLNNLLGGDWAPENAEVSVVYLAKRGKIAGCEAPVLGTYVEDISWATGITRTFDSERSIEKKAKDITKLLSEAVLQVPNDKPSMIHVAAETLEGKDVELRRTEKVLAKIPKFVTEKPVLGIRFHRFMSNSRTNMLFEFDETVEKFQVDGAYLADLPLHVVVPDNATFKKGRHWEIYD